jgi:hypothetical protein
VEVTKRNLNRELARGLWHAVKSERGWCALILLFVVNAWWMTGFVGGVPWTLVVILYVFAMFFRNEARGALETVCRLLDKMEQERRL